MNENTHDADTHLTQWQTRDTTANAPAPALHDAALRFATWAEAYTNASTVAEFEHHDPTAFGEGHYVIEVTDDSGRDTGDRLVFTEHYPPSQVDADGAPTVDEPEIISYGLELIHGAHTRVDQATYPANEPALVVAVRDFIDSPTTPSKLPAPGTSAEDARPPAAGGSAHLMDRLMDRYGLAGNRTNGTAPAAPSPAAGVAPTPAVHRPASEQTSGLER